MNDELAWLREQLQAGEVSKTRSPNDEELQMQQKLLKLLWGPLLRIADEAQVVVVDNTTYLFCNICDTCTDLSSWEDKGVLPLSSHAAGCPMGDLCSVIHEARKSFDA